MPRKSTMTKKPSSSSSKRKSSSVTKAKNRSKSSGSRSMSKASSMMSPILGQVRRATSSRATTRKSQSARARKAA